VLHGVFASIDDAQLYARDFAPDTERWPAVITPASGVGLSERRMAIVGSREALMALPRNGREAKNKVEIERQVLNEILTG